MEDGMRNWAICPRYHAQGERGGGGGEEKEPPDPGEAEEAEWEDIPSGEDVREAGRGTAGGGRPTKARRGPRSTKLGRLEKGRGEASTGGEGGRSNEPRTPRNCPRHQPAEPAQE